jgi:hypothetical protein
MEILRSKEANWTCFAIQSWSTIVTGKNFCNLVSWPICFCSECKCSQRWLQPAYWGKSKQKNGCHDLSLTNVFDMFILTKLGVVFDECICNLNVIQDDMCKWLNYTMCPRVGLKLGDGICHKFCQLSPSILILRLLCWVFMCVIRIGLVGLVQGQISCILYSNWMT